MAEKKKSIESILNIAMVVVGRTTKHKKNWGTQNEDKYVCRVRARTHARTKYPKRKNKKEKKQKWMK